MEMMIILFRKQFRELQNKGELCLFYSIPVAQVLIYKDLQTRSNDEFSRDFIKNVCTYK